MTPRSFPCGVGNSDPSSLPFASPAPRPPTLGLTSWRSRFKFHETATPTVVSYRGRWQLVLLHPGTENGTPDSQNKKTRDDPRTVLITYQRWPGNLLSGKKASATLLFVGLQQ
jgi:hypothetical protein